MKAGFIDSRKNACHESWAKAALLSFIAIAAVTVNTAHAQTCDPRLYGAAYSGPNDLATLYSIDPVTRTDQKIGATG